MIEQRSLEWFEQRKGKFTASTIFNLMGARGLGKTGETYILKKVAESFGVYEEDVYSKAITWGNETEQFAADYYEAAFNVNLETCGFFESKVSPGSGSSPDRLIKGQNKGIEIKCPYVPSNHIKHMTIRSNEDLKKINPQYYWQVQKCMADTNFPVWDFVSFDPRFTGNLRMFAVEIKANESDQILMAQRTAEAVDMRDKIIKQIQL